MGMICCKAYSNTIISMRHLPLINICYKYKRSLDIKYTLEKVFFKKNLKNLRYKY